MKDAIFPISNEPISCHRLFTNDAKFQRNSQSSSFNSGADTCHTLAMCLHKTYLKDFIFKIILTQSYYFSEGFNQTVLVAGEWGHVELEHFRGCEHTVSWSLRLLFWLCKSCYLLQPMERIRPPEAVARHTNGVKNDTGGRSVAYFYRQGSWNGGESGRERATGKRRGGGLPSSRPVVNVCYIIICLSGFNAKLGYRGRKCDSHKQDIHRNSSVCSSRTRSEAVRTFRH